MSGKAGSLGYEVNELHRVIREKHPLFCSFERKFHRLTGLIGWIAATVALCIGYKHYLPHVPTAEQLAYIDTSMYIPFFTPLAGPFELIFRYVPLCAPLYTGLMSIYSLVVLFASKQKERELRAKFKPQRNGMITAFVVGVVVMGGWTLSGFNKFIIDEIAKGSGPEPDNTLQMIPIVLIYLLCYVYTLAMFFSDVHDGLLRPYHLLLTFLREFFEPGWFFVLVISMAIGPLFIPITLTLLVYWYVLRLLFSPTFWKCFLTFSLSIGAIAVITCASGPRYEYVDYYYYDD